MNLLCQLLTEQLSYERLTDSDCDLLIRQSRKCLLLPQVAQQLLPYQSQFNPALVRHLQSARIISQAQVAGIHWELNRLQNALSKSDAPIILLKGAAYLAQELPHSSNRLYGDIDLLVPESEISHIEELLKWSGWISSHHDDYDDRYYRRWMHEIPPLQHASRASVLDVHHRILPPTAKITVPGEPLIEHAIHCAAFPFFKVLSPVDQVMHSSAHLFSEGETDHGLRDLLDIYQLIQYFQKDEPQFIEKWIERSNTLGLSRFTYYALRYLRHFLWPSLPLELERSCRDKPSPFTQRMMHKLMIQLLLPNHMTCRTPLSPSLEKALFIRGHYLRMPLHLLIPHLARKAFIKDQSASEQSVPEKTAPEQSEQQQSEQQQSEQHPLP